MDIDKPIGLGATSHMLSITDILQLLEVSGFIIVTPTLQKEKKTRQGSPC